MLAAVSVSVSLCLSGVLDARADGQELATQHYPVVLVLPSVRRGYPLPASQDPFFPKERKALRQKQEGVVG